ncbi:hypothetical protein PC116_g12700 [Phytophthora cactorum]|nr:hypothetical protein PC116_g12700 [Phytophthora cactorum]
MFLTILGGLQRFEAIVTDAEVPLVALHSRELVNNSDSDGSRVPPTTPAYDTDNEYEEKPESDVHVAKCLNLDDVVIEARTATTRSHSNTGVATQDSSHSISIDSRHKTQETKDPVAYDAFR